MAKIYMTKKRIIGLVLLFVMTNVGVNVSLTMPLAYMDYKLLSFEYIEGRSTSEYSYLLAKIMVRNNYWLPAKVDLIRFQIIDSVSGKVCGEGTFGPINVDPGHFDIIKIVIKLYKNDATQNFIKEFIRTQKISGKIKAYYPVSLFGLITIFRLPAEIPISSLFSEDSIGGLDILPEFDVEDIKLTKETSEYAEAMINISGEIPAEFSKIGTVKIWDAEFNIISDEGHVISMSFDRFTLDSNIGKFTTIVKLRFIKGDALQSFLDKAIKGKEISGKISGKMSIEIFGINVTGATYESDLGQYGNIFDSSKTSSSGIFAPISDMLKDIVEGVNIKYYGKKESMYGDEHTFGAEVSINNNLNWTLGWGNMNITFLSKGNDEQYPCIVITQKGDFSVGPGEEQKFVANVTLYDNDGLGSFMRKVLYQGQIDANLTGSIDVYFAGVWIRNIDISSPVGSSLMGGTAEQAGMFDDLMPMGTNVGSLIGNTDYGISSFEVLATDEYLLVRARINMTYSRMPIKIYNVRGDIIYRNMHIGSVFIDRIDLNPNTDSNVVVCTPRIEVRLDKSSIYLNQFIGSFVSGEWPEGTLFIGSLDIDFLSKTYRNVPIEYSNNIIGEGGGMLPVDAVFDFYEIKNVTYIGERYENGHRVYDIKVDSVLHNIVGATIEIRYVDIELALASNNISFARISMNKNVIIGGYSSKDVEIYVSIYDNDAFVTYLNKTLRGQQVEIVAKGSLNVLVGGVEISLDDLNSRISSSITDTLSGSMNATSYLYGTDIRIINMTEYSNRIEILIDATVGVPLQVKIKSLFAYVSIYQDSTDPPVTLELMDEIAGPGASNATFRFVLYNSSSEFENFVKGYVYGDISDLFANAFVDIEIFGHEFKGIEFRRVKVSTQMGEQESVFSAIKVDEMLKINDFEYLGMVEKDGVPAYALNLSVEIDNAFGISFALYDSKIYIMKNDKKIMRIDIVGVYDVMPYENKTLNLMLYVYNGTDKAVLKQFLEELIMDQIFDANVSAQIGIKIFGVDIPNIEFISRVFIDLSEQSGISNYQDIGLMLNGKVDDIEVLVENDTITILNVSANISVPCLPLRIFSTEVNISLPGHNSIAISVFINSTIDLYLNGNKTVFLLVDLYKYDIDHVHELLKRLIENEINGLRVEGTSEIELFGVNLSLSFSYDNITFIPTTSEIAVAGLSADIPMNVEEIKYVGEKEIGGEKIYEFSVSISVENILNTTLIIGPLNISIIRDNETAMDIILNKSTLYGLSTNNINMTIMFYSHKSTYEFLKDLIEEFTINCTISGYGNISIFGIDINNVYLSYPILMELREDLLESAPSNMPGTQQLPTDMAVILLNSTDWYSDVKIIANVTNNMALPLEIWNVSLYVTKDVERVFLIRLIEPIDLEENNVTIAAWLRLYKTSAIDSIIREILSGDTFPVEISGNATFRFLEWNFTAQIDISDLEYSTEGISDGEIPVSKVEIESSEKIGDALYVYVTMVLDDMPIPLTVKNLNISLSNEYGDIGRVIIDEAEIRNSTQSVLNITLVLYDKDPNIALEYFIRGLVEKNYLFINITGTTDAVIFGLSIENISIDFELNQTLSGAGEGIATGSFIPLESFFAINSIEQITFGDRDSYDLLVNASVSSPIDTLIKIWGVNISLYVDDIPTARVIINESYDLVYSNDTNVSMFLTIYDTEGAYNLLNSMISGEAINMTVIGALNLYVLGANISNLYVDYTFTFELDQETYSANTNVLASDMVSYCLDKIKILGENGQIANISATVNITDIPIYLQINYVNLTISNQYGGIGEFIINGPTILSPENVSSLDILISVYRGRESLKRFIEDYLKYSNATVSLSGYIDVKLFSSTNQYLTISANIEIENMTFTMNNTGESLIPLDMMSIVQYEDMEYKGVDNSTGIDGYILEIQSLFVNEFNITFTARDMRFELQSQNVTIISGVVPEIDVRSEENKTIEANITVYDRIETAEFLQNLINNNYMSANVSIWVGSIEIFGVEINNISLNQVFGWNLSQQLEGSNVQSSVLTLFEIRMGEIVVLGEDNDTAKLRFNITVYNAKIPVNVSGFDADLYYSRAKVANVHIATLEINNTKNTSFLVNVTIFKDNKTALRGFLMDLLVNKNITMDVWGNTSINLFGSGCINLNVSFKYNNTVYAVSDYYDSLVSGEVDASSFLDQIIRYSAEDVKWEIVEENVTHVIMRLNESLWSALNLKIFRMYTRLHMDPLNASTIFAIQRLVDYLDVPANGTGEICIEIIFIKNEYLQQFLGSVLHNWTINVWADTIIDLEIFGVNITGLEALSAKFSYLITTETIQDALNSMVEGYVNDVNADVVYLEPIGYGNWYNPSDPYGGIRVVVEDPDSYAYKIWKYDEALINVWDYSWLLIKYVQALGEYDFNVTLLNFRAILVFTGVYENGTMANATADDFFGEIYIDNLTLVRNQNNTFFAYIRLWRLNRLRGLRNSSLRDWLWNMVKYHSYNFSIVNVTFDIQIWGCNITNITLDKLNFTGMYDPSDLSDTIKFNGLSSYTVGFNLNQGVYADVTFKIEVPMSPEWLVYYYMLIVWDDDPIFFEDYDTCPDDPPAAGGFQQDNETPAGFNESGTYKSSEVEEFKALDPAATPLGHDVSKYYEAPLMTDAPNGLPDYVVWFGTGGEYELSARIDIEWDDGHHDYFGNIDVDQKYDDEYYTSQGLSEEEDANGDAGWLLNWEGTEDGDMWVLVMFSYEVEILMFWWVIYYYTPIFYISAGDWNPNVISGFVKLYDTQYWELHDYYYTHDIFLVNTNGTVYVKPHPNATYMEPVTVSGMCFYDSFDGAVDSSEPDYSGNYFV